MVLYDQTIRGELGNCLQACLATLLQLPMEQVPNFSIPPTENWYERFINWVMGAGYHVATLQEFHELHSQSGLVLVFGYTDSGGYHAVIYENGQLLHDPCPEPEFKIGVEKLDWAAKLIPA